MRNLVLLLLLLAGAALSMQAQKAPIKFGTLDKAELTSTVYAPDTTAPAVILCDYGYFNATLFTTTRLLRIKILKAEGLSWADQVFDLDSKTDIRGITYNLVNDEVVETKLKNESIFKTRITENDFEMRIAMPNVKVGSVIDLRFSYSSIPTEWEFQQEIPVVHSELELEPSLYITFQKNFFGYYPLTVNTRNRWVSENVPAFKPEPYMTSSKNYRTRLEFDISNISFPGYYRSIASSWEAIRDLLYEDSNFGIALNSDGYARSKASEIKSLTTSPDEMIRMAYDYVKAIKWNKAERLYTENNLISTAYKEGKGNSSEVNLALVQLLRRLGFKAGPVVMSSRRNGRLSEIRPSLYKLNYVIAAVFTDTDTLLLDATEEHCPSHLLPMRALNSYGRYMDKNTTFWLPLTTDKKDRQMIMYTFDIGADRSLKGTISYSKSDYAALDFRNSYDQYNSEEEYLTDFKEGKKGLRITSHNLTNLDSLYQSIKEDFEISVNGILSEIDGDLYLTPVLYEQMKENPFKEKERQYPIDFGYAREKTIIANYTIPEGYTVSSIPAPVNMKIKENAATFSVKSSVNGNKITLMYKFCINNPLILMEDYSDLRELYNQMVTKHAEPIVLKKI
jgi:hypothetical protein